MRRITTAVVIGVFAAACGTGSTDVDFDEPASTLFPDEETAETVDGSTTTTQPVGVADLDPELIPGPRPGALGVVVFESVAAPVAAIDGAEWTIETPCGATRSGMAPNPTTATVVIDPTGDAGSDAGAVALSRNAAIADAVRARLESADIATITTRDATADVPAPYRRLVADASGARVMVSIAFVDGVGELGPEAGLEVVHPAADTGSRRLAGLVYAAVDPVIERYAVSWPDDLDPGVRAVLNQRGSDYFTVLQDPSGAARVVVHLPVDPAVAATLWAVADNINPLSVAIADAIVRYLVTEAEGTGFVAPPEVVRDAVATDPAAICVDPIGEVAAGG